MQTHRFPGGCEGLKSAATSRSLGNRGCGDLGVTGRDGGDDALLVAVEASPTAVTAFSCW